MGGAELTMSRISLGGEKGIFCCKREDCIFILIVFKITLGPKHNTKARHKLSHSAHSAFVLI